MSRKTFANRFGHFLGKAREWPGLLWRFEAQIKGVNFEGKCQILGRPLISVAKNGTIRIANGCRLYSALRANPLGCFQPCVLRALTPGSKLLLGPRVGLSGTVLCAAKAIEIGEGTIFGSGAMVIDNDFHSPNGDWDWTEDPDICADGAEPVKIGRGVFVAARALILKGVTVGDRAVIGAGAVVTKDVPANALAVGNPVRVIEPERGKA